MPKINGGEKTAPWGDVKHADFWEKIFCKYADFLPPLKNNSGKFLAMPDIVPHPTEFMQVFFVNFDAISIYIEGNFLFPLHKSGKNGKIW